MQVQRISDETGCPTWCVRDHADGLAHSAHYGTKGTVPLSVEIVPAHFRRVARMARWQRQSEDAGLACWLVQGDDEGEPVLCLADPSGWQCPLTLAEAERFAGLLLGRVGVARADAPPAGSSALASGCPAWCSREHGIDGNGAVTHHTDGSLSQVMSRVFDWTRRGSCVAPARKHRPDALFVEVCAFASNCDPVIADPVVIVEERYAEWRGEAQHQRALTLGDAEQLASVLLAQVDQGRQAIRDSVGSVAA